MNVLIDGVRYVPAPAACDNPGLLDVVGDFSDAGGEMTIREFLHALLSRLWSEGESFSGKRPFGNSGWEYDLYHALAGVGAIQVEVTEHGEIINVPREERQKADKIVFGLIAEMCGVPK